MSYAFTNKVLAQQLCWPLISVAPGNESATIRWENVPGATGYNLYWGTSPEINTFNMFTMKVPLVTSPFVQTQLANGVKYYFIVQAISNKTSSYGSNIVSAVPMPDANSSRDTITIRPFGNSITFGIGFADNTYCPVYAAGQSQCPATPVNWGGGYRGWMTLILNNNQNIFFKTEGHQNGGSNLLQWQTSTQSHDGYPGFWTHQMIDPSKMPSSADITLVHAGTNDLFWTFVFNAYAGKDTSWSVAPFADTLFTVLDNILSANAKTKVYVAKIIKVYPGSMVLPSAAAPLNAKIDQYNERIEQKWMALPPELKSRVTVVDMNSILTSASDYTLDGVHPSRTGYLKMACSWIRAINGIGMEPGDPCSCITTNAVINLMPQH
ncbi:MAG: GDSL-type esterase/lipase family protein [Bacteroidia bacterium]